MNSHLADIEMSRFGRTVGWAAFLTFDLIILGSLVRATDSGLACPDWPLCYNQLAPAMDTQIFLEWFHRLSALILGGVVLRAVYLIGKSKAVRKEYGAQIALATVLFLVQCILGGLTVLELLDPTIVSMHLINALIFLGILIWAFLKTWLRTENSRTEKLRTTMAKVPPKIKMALGVLTVLFFGQVLLGGLVSSNHAGLVCPDFPKCQGQWLPEGSYLLSLQAYHRLAAYLLAASITLFSLVAARFFRARSTKLAILSLPALIVGQIALGMINVYYALPVWASVTHLANALLINTILFMVWAICQISARNGSQISGVTKPSSAPRLSFPNAPSPAGDRQS